MLQRFLTGLLPSLSRQVLLRGKPTTFDQAVKEAGEIEYALNFESKGESQKEVNLVPQRKGPTEFEKLHENLEMLKRLEKLGNQSERKGAPQQGSTQGKG